MPFAEWASSPMAATSQWRAMPPSIHARNAFPYALISGGLAYTTSGFSMTTIYYLQQCRAAGPESKALFRLFFFAGQEPIPDMVHDPFQPFIFDVVAVLPGH
jgi:hypothetical protein